MIAFWVGAAIAAAPGTFEGTWVLNDVETQRATVADVVEGGAQRFNFVLRPIARRALTKACAVDEKIEVSGDASMITMTYTGSNSRVSSGPPDGTHVELRGSDVTFDVQADKMVIAGTSKDGGKAATYVVTGDAMKVSYKIWSSQLGDPPLTWTMQYTRQ